jgi:hypothetical protein
VYWGGNLRERDNLDNLSLEGKEILKWTIKKWDGVWSGLIWLTFGISDGLL